MSVPDLKPLAMGEMIDRSVSFWRAHWKTLFKLFLVFELVVYGLLKAGTLAAQHAVPYLFSQKLLDQVMKEGADPAPLLIAALGMIAITVVDLTVGWWVGAAGTRFCFGQLTGAPVTLAEAVAQTRGRTRTILGACALACLLWALAGLLCAIPGLALAIYGATSSGLAAVIGGVV